MTASFTKPRVDLTTSRLTDFKKTVTVVRTSVCIFWDIRSKTSEPPSSSQLSPHTISLSFFAGFRTLNHGTSDDSALRHFHSHNDKQVKSGIPGLGIDFLCC